MEETFGRAGLIARRTCFSLRAIGFTLFVEFIEFMDLLLSVGEVGVGGRLSSDPVAS